VVTAYSIISSLTVRPAGLSHLSRWVDSARGQVGG
jgi:hypothetical protein